MVQTYLDIEFLVDLECIAEEIDVLNQVGELPVVPDLDQQAGRLRSLVLRRRGFSSLRFCPAALASGHGRTGSEGARTGSAAVVEGSEAVAAVRFLGRWSDCKTLLELVNQARRERRGKYAASSQHAQYEGRLSNYHRAGGSKVRARRKRGLVPKIASGVLRQWWKAEAGVVGKGRPSAL